MRLILIESSPTMAQPTLQIARSRLCTASMLSTGGYFSQKYQCPAALPLDLAEGVQPEERRCTEEML